MSAVPGSAPFVHLGAMSPRFAWGAAAVLVVTVIAGLQAVGGTGVGTPRSTATDAPSMTAPPLASTPLPVSPGPVAIGWAWPPTLLSNRAPARTLRDEGPLDAGVYEVLDVDRQGFNMAFTLPAGWSWDGRRLRKAGTSTEFGAAIGFYGGPIEVYADPCHWAGGAASPRPVDPGAAGIVRALAAQPSRAASTPIDLRPDADLDHRAMAVLLSVPDDIDIGLCDLGEYRSWGPAGNARSHEGQGQRDMVWAIEVDGAAIEWAAPPPGGLMVDAAWFPETPGSLVSEMQAILASLYVGHWG